MSDDDNVKPLGVRFKQPPGEDAPALQLVRDYKACGHQYESAGSMQPVTYYIREGETEVECGACHAKLDPMWVLQKLAGRESRYREFSKRYHEELARLQARVRTTCEHCGKMTRISRT